MLDVVVRALEPVNITSDTASSVRLGRGGSGANIAVELALDHHVAFVGAVGNDAAGEVFLADLRAADVTPLVQVLPGATGVVVAFVNDDGERAMLSDRGVNPRLSDDAVHDALAVPFDHLHVSGYTFLDSRTRRIASDALGIARQLGATTSVDVCSVAPLRKLGAAKFLKAIGRGELPLRQRRGSLRPRRVEKPPTCPHGSAHPRPRGGSHPRTRGRTRDQRR